MKRLLLTLSAASAISFGVVAQSNGERTITGTVTYAGDNEPLIGATVMPVGHGTGVATDADGHFSITVGPDIIGKTKSAILKKRKVHFLVFSGHFGRVCLTAVQSSLKRCLIG